MKSIFWILLSNLVITLAKENDDNSLIENGEQRDGKVFSLFSIVQFNNEACRSSMVAGGGSSSNFRNGTCFTAQECAERGGSSSGSCAGGFGVCCVFMTSTCGASVNQNCSYVKNPNFPSPLTTTTPCSFTINKCAADVCDFRLDFEMFTTNGPASSSEPNGGTCQDALTVMTGTGQTIPEICGSNTGQHIYVDVGRGASDSATLQFAFSGTFNRLFDIKITQIPCSSPSAPPDGCLQYHTDLSGRFTTFNFDANFAHLRNQQQSVCIRQQEGFCCIAYSVCADDNSMSIGNGGSADLTLGAFGSNCPMDFVVIEASSGSGNGNLQNRYCGGKLSGTTGAVANDVIRDCTQPFQVTFVTDNAAEGTATTVTNGNRGTCLMYTQEPCRSMM